MKNKKANTTKKVLTRRVDEELSSTIMIILLPPVAGDGDGEAESGFPKTGDGETVGVMEIDGVGELVKDVDGVMDGVGEAEGEDTPEQEPSSAYRGDKQLNSGREQSSHWSN